MIIKSIAKITKEKFQTICLFTDKKGLSALKKDFPEITPYLKAEPLTYDSKTILTLPIVNKGKVYTYHIVGFEARPSLQAIYNAFGSVAKKFSGAKNKHVVCHLASLTHTMEDKNLFIAAIKGLSAGAYSLNKFQSEHRAEAPSTLDLALGSRKISGYLKEALTITESILVARRLVDEPANLLKPTQLAEMAQENLADLPIEVKVMSRKEIEKLGMNLYLAVAKGSDAEPKLIVMRYKGDPDSKERVGLIGKGLTFDSGGYSLKPTPSMLSMKMDMGGSAAVIGAMKLIGQEKPKVNVVAVVASCENMISGHSYLPGDILTSMNGKTVEIGNTDAEGRLTLADAITYAIRKENATKIVDICTLTGACLMALGEEYAGVVTWKDALWKKIESISKQTLEPCWRLPINEAIKNMNKGTMADLKNIGGQFCGASTAGSFLGEFVEDLPWIHIDIAGTAMFSSEKTASRIGATGYGVHLLAELVKKL